MSDPPRQVAALDIQLRNAKRETERVKKDLGRAEAQIRNQARYIRVIAAMLKVCQEEMTYQRHLRNCSLGCILEPYGLNNVRCPIGQEIFKLVEKAKIKLEEMQRIEEAGREFADGTRRAEWEEGRKSNKGRSG